MSTQTPNYNFTLPGVGDPTDQDLWGGELNGNFTSLDGLLKIATNSTTASITGTYTVVAADRNTVKLLDATAGDFSVTMPDPTVVGNGFRVSFKKIDASANAITILPFSAETFDGAATYSLSTQYAVITLVTNGTNWFLVSSNISPKAPTRQYLKTGTTYTTPANCRVIRAKFIGGGGGGGGATLGSASGGSGGDTSFNSITAKGGGGGTDRFAGGIGGTGGTGTADLRIPGGHGGDASYGTGNSGGLGGSGASGPWGGAGFGVDTTGNLVNGYSAVPNTGSGGGGAGVSATYFSGGGGGAGEYVELFINNPSATYAYVIGTAGAAGTGVTYNGGLGATGFIEVEEYY